MKPSVPVTKIEVRFEVSWTLHDQIYPGIVSQFTDNENDVINNDDIYSETFDFFNETWRLSDSIRTISLRFQNWSGSSRTIRGNGE